MSDAERFRALVEPHFAVLHRTALRLTRSRPDAEDLVQDVCLRAYSKLDDLERAERPAAWLQRVQYRIFVDGDRHRKRSPFAPLPDPAAVFDLAPSDAPGPDDVADGELLHRGVTEAWRHLGKEQQALLALHSEGYSLADLERITGASRNAVGVRLHRARSQLAKLLKLGLAGRMRWAQMES